jgi:hypothetical protein
LPALIPPGPVIRVQFNTGTNASIEAGSRFFISYTGAAPTGGDLTTFSADVAAAWGTHINPLVDTTEALHGVICTDLATSSGAVGEWAGTIAGGLTGGAPLPANICAVVNHGIGRRYRGGRPRTYLRCGDDDTSHVNGTNEWTTTFQGVILTGWQAFIAEVLAVSGLGFTPNKIVNVSWYNGNTVFTTSTGRARNIPKPRVTPLIDSILNSAVSIKLGSQRKRLDI